MTTKPTLAPDQLARVAQALERLLPPGHQLVHTKHGWWLKKFDSWTIQLHGERDAEPRMGWRDVDSDKSLAALLERLGEHA